MNKEIITQIAIELNVKEKQVENTLKLLEEGNTVPFIARYRKEATGALDEEQIRSINEVYEYQVNLLKRKEDVIRLINEKGMLTDILKEEIMKCTKLIEVEDLYRPYKEKKKTKATEAIANGLEPLAKIIMSFPLKINIEDTAQKYINDKVSNTDEAISGAKYIISEWISDNASYRKYIRNNIYNFGTINSKIKKNAKDEGQVYRMYYNYSERIKNAKEYRILAINRGEKEGVLTVSINVDLEHIMNFLEKKIIKNEVSPVVDIVKDAIYDSYKRLIFPSIEREIRGKLKEEAEEGAIDVFGKNLEKLLLTPPIKDKVILGFDPAFRTGCKLAVIDRTSKVLNISKIYPHDPQNKWKESKNIIKNLIDTYNIDVIAVGNGTASRESEKLVSEVCSEYKRKKVEYIIVSEAGASVYSASKLAISEFPDLHVEERSAISIGRRLQDPLSELVKIDPKSIGVGQYQHDVNQKRLNESLDFIVEKSVNLVGVNINTASPSILKYVSGITKTNIDKILKYRDTNGKINSREELIKNKVLTAKAYEQSIGFMRIIDGKNLLDKTPIHPESYEKTLKLFSDIDMPLESIGSEELNKKLDELNLEKYSLENNIDKFTLEDIIKCLKQPNRDFRDDFIKPLLKSNILNIEDLRVGMRLEGTVRNVVDFGAFVDIGLHDDGLVHISKLTKEYIKHPMEVVNVGDIVTCYVDKIDFERNKVNLSLISTEVNA